jgi:hypothetical protein
VIRFLWCAPCLIVHNADKPARLVLRKPQAFRIIKVGDLWRKAGEAFAVVLGDMALEELLLNEVMEAFVGKVDGKLVEGIGSGSEALGSGKVEKANEGGKLASAEAFVNVFIKPREQQEVECLRKVVTVAGYTTRRQKDGRICESSARQRGHPPHDCARDNN